MLEAMKRGAQTWVAKILFGLLVLSFAIWGVADVFTGIGRGAVATIGSSEISAQEVQRAYQSELEQFSRDAKQRITPEQGRSLGLDRRVLNQLIGGAAIESHAENMGLALSDTAIVEGVHADPDFQIDGKFSRDGFNNLLRQLDLSEKGFINLRRKDELRSQILGSMVKAQTVPMPMIEAQHRYQNEKRKIEWVTIDTDKAITVAEPDEAKLKSLYEADKAKYMTPEYRKFQILILDTSSVKPLLTVTDTEIETSYGETKDTYNTPEQRRIQQIAFKDKAAADAAHKALLDGSKTFADVAKDAGAKDTDVDLGLLAKKALIDPKIGDAAFALEKDKYSDVIEGRFATVILRVTQIEPGVMRTLADVKEQVRDKLAEAKARIEVPLRFDAVEDLRSAGKTLKEIAETTKLPLTEVAAADRRGLTPDQTAALQSADLQKIMARVFTPDGGGEDELVELTTGGHGWINRLGATPPAELPFEKVKAEIKDGYMTSERDRMVSELAKKLVAELNTGADKAQIEKEAHSTFAVTDPVTRATVPQGLTEAAVGQAFTLPLNRASNAVSANKSSQSIFRVTEVVPAAAMTAEQIKAITAELNAELANQTLTEYTERLKADLGTSVNETEFRRALGLSE